MGRNILAVIGGSVAAGAVVALVEAIGHTVLKGEAVFGAAAAGYGLGAAAGTATATLIAGRGAAIAVPVILAMLALANLLSFAHPRWFAPVALLALVTGWYAGRAIVRARGTAG